MGQRTLLGPFAVILAALILAACGSPLPTGVADIPAPSGVETVAGDKGPDAPEEAGSWHGVHRSGGWKPAIPAEALMNDGTGWLGGGG